MSLQNLFWKLEPCSPLLDPESPSSWSLEDYDVEEPQSKVEEEASAVVPTRADLAQQLLDDIEEYVKKEETFSDWFEEKVDLPIFDEIQGVVPGTPEPPLVGTILPMETLQTNIMKPEQELTYVLGQGHLTPPQSPPAAEVPMFIVPQPSYITLQPTSGFIAEPYLVAPPTPDLAREMAVVDEVVRGAAQQWEQWESSDSNSRSSEGTEDSDDPEWMPDESAPKPAARRARQSSRPYNTNDRRLRKKEQNKNAATRYRLKKKAEVCTIVEEERGLEDANASLQTKLTDLQREITYLKGLMRDVFRAKGLVQ